MGEGDGDISTLTSYRSSSGGWNRGKARLVLVNGAPRPQWTEDCLRWPECPEDAER